MNARSFCTERDLRSLQVFLAEMRTKVAQAAYFQYGDLLWRIHLVSNHFDRATDLCIWEEKDGRVAGFVHYLACEDNPEFFLRPELYDSGVADEMVEWAVARATVDGVPRIETSCIEHDSLKAAFLSRAGFTLMDDDAMVFMRRDLTEPLPGSELQIGFEFATAAERPDLTGVTGGSWTQQDYVAITGATDYRDELGQRVIHAGNEVAAGCIGWYDDRDRCGLFEPVGTVEAYRERGLARAVMGKVMHNLRNLGAESVYVRTGEDNLSAVRLYESLGFDVTDRDFGWARTV